MVQQNEDLRIQSNFIMNGEFYVQDYISSIKGVTGRKCNVKFSFEDKELVHLQLNNTDPAIRPAEIAILVKPNDGWLLYLVKTNDNTCSLVMVNTEDLSKLIVIEARKDEIPMLKGMEEKLREFLRVISYEIKVQDARNKNKPVIGGLHILRNKLIILTGLLPCLNKLLEYKFVPPRQGITLEQNKGLYFDELEGFLIVSDQRQEIWHTIQGCMKAAHLRDNKTKRNHSNIDLQSNFQNGKARMSSAVATKSETVEYQNILNFNYSKRSGTRNEHVEPSTGPANKQCVYFNLPMRPCKYIYMNLPDEEKARHLNHDYINVFHRGSVYQNFWRSCTKQKKAINEEESHVAPTEENVQLPPPCPPRLTPPPLPSKPKPKMHPSTSPLPNLHLRPCNLKSPPPLLPRASEQPPCLPVRRSHKQSSVKEIQYVVFSSKPTVGEIFIIQVVFFQKNDFDTLQRIKKLEDEANYQVLKSLPDTINVLSDLKISLVDIDECCRLKSDQYQVIEHEIVKEAILQSCWLIIEFHLEHNELSLRRNFHGKICMEPCTKSCSTSPRMSKEVQISTTFQDVIQTSSTCSPTSTMYNPLKSLGVRKYLNICSMMDTPCALHNDWTGLAGEIGLAVDEVFKIQSKACFPNYSPTNEVLNIWCQRQSKCCNLEQFKIMLHNLQRFDVLETMKEPES